MQMRKSCYQLKILSLLFRPRVEFEETILEYITLGHGLGKKKYSIDNFLNEEHQKYSIAICCKTYSLLLHMRKPDFILMIILDNLKYSRAYIC